MSLSPRVKESLRNIDIQRLHHRHQALKSDLFDLLDEHCGGQNGLHIHFARQCNGIGNGVAQCGQTLVPH